MPLRICKQWFCHTKTINFPFALATFAIIWLLSSSTQFLAQNPQKPADTNGITQDEKSVRRLEQGKPVERELKGGEVHAYEIALTAGQFLKAVIEQRGIDVEVLVFAPDGKQIMKVDSPNGTQGPEPISMITESTGIYRLDIHSLEKDVPAGRYEVKIEELRTTMAHDKTRLAAEQIFVEAAQLVVQGKTQKALELYLQSLALFKSIGNNDSNNSDRLFQAKILSSIGSLYDDLKENQKALEFYNQSLEVYKAIGDRVGEANALTGIALVYASLDDKQKQFEFYNQAILVYRLINDKKQEAIMLRAIGALHNDLDENQRAIGFLNQSLEMFQGLNDKREVALTLLAMGASYDKLGDWQKAIELYNQALPVFRALGEDRWVSNTLNNTGGVYYSLGDYRKALDYFTQSHELSRKMGQPGRQANNLNNIGSSYRKLGEKREALKYFNQALLLIRAEGFRRGEVIILGNIGNTYRELGDLPKALDFLKQSHEIATASNIRREDAYTLGDLGLVYHVLGEKEKAIMFLNQSLALTRQVNDRSREAYTLASIAKIERDVNNLSEARTQIESAINIVELLRAKIISQDSRSSYFASVQDYYELYTDILMRLHKESPSENLDALALQANERARARNLLELLIESRADIRQGVDSSLLERERTLQRQLNSKAQQQTQLLESKETEEKAAKIKNEIDALTNELQQVETEIRQKSPRYAALTQPQPLSLKEIQTLVLDSDTLLLEYSLGEEKSYLWAVTSDSITSYELPKRAEIEAAAISYYKLVSGGNSKNISVKAQTNSPLAKEQKPITSTDTELSEAASRLSQMIIAPVAAQLGTNRLLIVADGALQYIPFTALPETTSNSTADVAPNNAINVKVKTTATAAKNNASQPLVFNHEIVSLPSASTLTVLRREFSGRKPVAGTVAVVADPVFSKDDVRVDEVVSRRQTKTNGADNEKSSKIPVSSTIVTRALEETGISRDGLSLARLDATRTEANSILALAPVNSGMKALSFQASRSTVTSGELARYRIVHFATHGLLNSEHPELSGIVLSLVDERGEPQDGFLRLHEIYNLKLPAELVVLSACQTALGKEIKGEGLVGLTRGFMYAGAPRVVASLWKVDDAATRDLMTMFYRAMLTDKLRPAAALRKAQIEMSKQKRWSNPYNWSAFVLQGEWK